MPGRPVFHSNWISHSRPSLLCNAGLEVIAIANVSAEAGTGSRYTRVKAILEAAAAGGASDYGGLGRFWDLPLDALVEAKVFGVRLIAPAVQASTMNQLTGVGFGLVRPQWSGR